MQLEIRPTQDCPTKSDPFSEKLNLSTKIYTMTLTSIDYANVHFKYPNLTEIHGKPEYKDLTQHI